MVVTFVHFFNSEKLFFIERCPECDFLLERNEGEAQHYCKNHNFCNPQIKGKIRSLQEGDGKGHDQTNKLVERYRENYKKVLLSENQYFEQFSNMMNGALNETN